jgi:hypothetical protein
MRLLLVHQFKFSTLEAYLKHKNRLFNVSLPLIIITASVEFIILVVQLQEHGNKVYSVEKVLKEVFSINLFVLIIGFIWTGRSILKNLEMVCEGIYREKRKSVILATSFQSGTLFLLFLRFFLETMMWKAFGDFVV